MQKFDRQLVGTMVEMATLSQKDKSIAIGLSFALCSLSIEMSVVYVFGTNVPIN